MPNGHLAPGMLVMLVALSGCTTESHSYVTPSENATAGGKSGAPAQTERSGSNSVGGHTTDSTTGFTMGGVSAGAPGIASATNGGTAGTSITIAVDGGTGGTVAPLNTGGLIAIGGSTNSAATTPSSAGQQQTATTTLNVGTTVGGAATGGATGGGTAAGGKTTTGGAATGGAATGGAATGGAATGGTTSTTPVDCSGAPSGWQGCRGSGCTACEELVSAYPLYFAHRPNCSVNTTCNGAGFSTCSTNCWAPGPDDADSACAGVTASTTWPICTTSGCMICKQWLAGFPLYLDHHPKCKLDDTCIGRAFGTMLACGSNCPGPTEADRAVGVNCAGSASSWVGCRGSGCAVCTELVDQYPRYFDNHPNCSRNWSCKGSYGSCSTECPPPTNADK